MTVDSAGFIPAASLKTCKMGTRSQTTSGFPPPFSYCTLVLGKDNSIRVIEEVYRFYRREKASLQWKGALWKTITAPFYSGSRPPNTFVLGFLHYLILLFFICLTLSALKMNSIARILFVHFALPILLSHRAWTTSHIHIRRYNGETPTD